MSRRQRLLTCLTLFLLAQPGHAADAAPDLADFAFLHGYWAGSGFGGVSEEMWMPGGDGSLFGVFKQSSADGVDFTEFMEITRMEGQFVLRLKHFNPDFSGWEEKAEFVTFPLQSTGPGRADFDGLSYVLADGDKLRVTVQLRQSDGSSSSAVIELTRQPLP